MNLKITIALTSLLFVNYAHSDAVISEKGVIDITQKDIDLKFRDEVDVCKKKSDTFSLKLGCYDKVAKDYRIRNIWKRGSEEYFEKNYRPLKNKELLLMREELARQYRSARDRSTIRDHDFPPGEISKEIIEIEVSQVDIELGRRNRQELRRIARENNIPIPANIQR